MVTNDKDHLCTQVSYRLDLRGPSVVVQTTCSTSLVAVALACESLQGGRSDMALAGGVTVRVPQRGGYFYTPGSILSPDGHCRPFDANAQGTIVGSGVGVVVLKRLARRARRPRQHPRRDPRRRDQQRRQRQGRLHRAELPRPGGGYPRGARGGTCLARVDRLRRGARHRHDPRRPDRAVAALNEVFKAGTEPPRVLRPSAPVKSNFGHLSCAAGVAGSHQDRARARARGHPAHRPLPAPEPRDRLRRQPVLRDDAPAAVGAQRHPAARRGELVRGRRHERPRGRSRRRPRASSRRSAARTSSSCSRPAARPPSTPRAAVSRRTCARIRSSISPTSRSRSTWDAARSRTGGRSSRAATTRADCARGTRRARPRPGRARGQGRAGRVHVPGPGLAVPRHGRGALRERAGGAAARSTAAPACSGASWDADLRQLLFPSRRARAAAAEIAARHALGPAGAVHRRLRARRAVARRGASGRPA